jgi:AcrR family transcriptional regulator
MSTPETQARSVPPFADAACAELPTCARDRIFEAARLLFYRYGIRGVSVDQIAAEAKTTKVTLYRVFSSKDDLIVQVLEDHRRRFWEWWDTVIAPFDGNPRKQIEAVFEALTEQVCSPEAERGCPVANAAVEIVDEEHPAKRIIDEHSNELARRMRKLCKAMGAKNANEIGDSLTLLVEGVFAARIVFNGKRLVQSVSRAVRVLLDSAK